MSLSNETIASYKISTLLETASESTEKILDNTPGILVILNDKNHVIRTNKEFSELLNISMEDCLHFNFESLFSREDLLTFRHHINQLKNDRIPDNKISFKLDININKSPSSSAYSNSDGLSGENRHVFWQIFKNENKNHKEKHLITITGRDLTEVYQSEIKLMNIFSSLPLGMFMLSESGRIHEVLSRYCEVVFERNDLINKEFKSLLHIPPDDEGKRISDGIDMMISSIGKSKKHYHKVENYFPPIISILMNKEVNIDDDSAIKWIRLSHQPILQNGIVTGYILTLEDITETIFSKREIERVRLLEKQSLALYECAIRDPLSGLYTRLFMKDSVKNLVDSFQRENIGELALVIFDIDHFKRVNDTYGHITGDTVIKEVGRIIKEESRDSDLAVRYGGEEFLVILPSKYKTFDSGLNFAERVRESIEKLVIHTPDKQVISVSISAGIAYCKIGEILEELVHRADMYLYKAKNSGRNKSVSQKL